MQMRFLVFGGLLTMILACARTGTGGNATAPAEPVCAVLGDSSSPEGYFEFQVERPARLEKRGAAAAPASGRVIARFVVDTAGRPVVKTFKVVMTASPALIAPAQAVMQGSRYRPALRHGCRVNQIVMEPYVF